MSGTRRKACQRSPPDFGTIVTILGMLTFAAAVLSLWAKPKAVKGPPRVAATA